jgi:hypothetical protein
MEGVEKCGSKEQQRWRNLSFFMARLTVMGVEELGWKSALQRLLPQYGMPAQGTLAWSGVLAGQVLAAAQWFVHEGHGVWVWRVCYHRDKGRGWWVIQILRKKRLEIDASGGIELQKGQKIATPV